MSNHCRVFMFPSAFYNTISPGMSESESCGSASDPVPKKKKKLYNTQYFVKYARILFPLKVEHRTCFTA